MHFWEDQDFYYFWKEQGVPTTYGVGQSFLDRFDTILSQIDNIDKLTQIVQNQNAEFGRDNEYGLLNRLDNDTGGILYFAKNSKIYDEYKNLQKKGKISKIYLADVYGNLRLDKTIVCYPIMHHKHLDQKMVAIKSEKYIIKGRGTPNQAQTYIQKLYYDKESNISTLMVFITKGVRHQIRVHLSSIGHPIIGEKIYSKYKTSKNLHLWSIGLQINL